MGGERYVTNTAPTVHSYEARMVEADGKKEDILITSSAFAPSTENYDMSVKNEHTSYSEMDERNYIRGMVMMKMGFHDMKQAKVLVRWYKDKEMVRMDEVRINNRTDIEWE